MSEDLRPVAAVIEAALPLHAAGLSIEHNPHLPLYDTAEGWIDDQRPDWSDDDARRRAIETGDFWSLWWYPNSPVGHCNIAAPTLAELLAFASGVRGVNASGPTEPLIAEVERP